MSFLFYFPKLLEKCSHNNSVKTFKNYCRPVSILSYISKIYERLMFILILEYFEPVLSKFQFGFRKGFSAQHSL